LLHDAVVPHLGLNVICRAGNDYDQHHHLRECNGADKCILVGKYILDGYTNLPGSGGKAAG
jgi:hypothetical protein